MRELDLASWYVTPFRRADSSARRLWSVVFLLAMKDQAEQVCYDRYRGESGSLQYTVEGTAFDLVPLPTHLAGQLESVMRRAIRPRFFWLRNLFTFRRRDLRLHENGQVCLLPGHIVVDVDVSPGKVVLTFRPDAEKAKLVEEALREKLNLKNDWLTQD